MEIAAGIAILAFVVTVTTVGVRMLLLARRTRGTPELLMGLGMTLIGAFGYPGALIAGMGRLPLGEVNVPLWFAANLSTQVGLLLIYAFTRQVFRPQSAWALGLCVAAVVIFVGATAWIVDVLVHGDPSLSSALATRQPTALFLVGSAGCFLWSGIEGGVQFARARRRLAVGLSDPVVVNRFLLWCAFGVFASGINGVSAIAMAVGESASSAPPAMLALGILGMLGAGAMYLAFLPPAAYLARLRAPQAA